MITVAFWLFVGWVVFVKQKVITTYYKKGSPSAEATDADSLVEAERKSADKAKSALTKAQKALEKAIRSKSESDDEPARVAFAEAQKEDTVAQARLIEAQTAAAKAHEESDTKYGLFFNPEELRRNTQHLPAMISRAFDKVCNFIDRLI